nr:hypothetical protein [Roseobacter litoralis]
MVDFRLTTRRDAKAAKAFLNKAIERIRLYRPVTICARSRDIAAQCLSGQRTRRRPMPMS